ncbi:tyrosine-protein phosphatase non-receptor type substrate 1-like [Protopterus annectens]|uniref:tyrosine-protein phosphatase non-receptor type substrate 1-like n=1 Tax=Protopterus annectens TaxID=7888 RepID=UPI001CFA33D2|nr:tyrosine-protein phosphatase non-receptor type substrate 1-like [Protopterus annectens]
MATHGCLRKCAWPKALFMYLSRAKPSPPNSPPSLSGPIQRVWLNTPVTFNCTSAGFYPPEIHVTWWQNEQELHGAKSDVCSNDGSRTYQVQSTITVPAKIDSPVTCRINHSELNQPIHSTFNISDIVNEPSPPSVSGPDGQVLSNTNVTIYCKSAGFYPKEISVIWEQNGIMLQGSNLNIILNDTDKTYQALSNVTVTATINSTVTCRINHTAFDEPKQSIFELKNIVKGKVCSYLML